MREDEKLSILEHLREFRQRLVKSVIAVLVTTIISFIFARQIFHILILPAGDIKLIYIEMTEMLGTYMKVCLLSGLILAMPYLIYHFIMFVSPALTPREKKAVYLVLPWVTFMFAAGVLFGYFVLIPPATKFLITFGSDIATPQIKIGNYISIITRLLLAIGLVFEMPVVSTFLARIGVITSKWLAGKRKVAIIFAFILGAVITPTFDPINQSLVALPLIALYEMSIWLAKIFERKKEGDTTDFGVIFTERVPRYTGIVLLITGILGMAVVGIPLIWKDVVIPSVLTVINEWSAGIPISLGLALIFLSIKHRATRILACLAFLALIVCLFMVLKPLLIP